MLLWVLLRMVFGLLMLNWLYVLCDMFVVLGVVMLICGRLLVVVIIMVCCECGVDGLVMIWVCVVGSVSSCVLVSISIVKVSGCRCVVLSGGMVLVVMLFVLGVVLWLWFSFDMVMSRL